MPRRVVVTGIGAVTPLGTGAEKAWQRLLNGESGVGPITKFDTSAFSVRIAAELKDFDAQDFMEKKRVRRTDPFIHYALAATSMAIEDSRLSINEHNAPRVGVVIGTCIGGMLTYEKNVVTLREEGPDRISPFFVTGFIPNMALAEIAIAYGMKGPSQCVVTACATGGNAIGDALRHIQRGDADAMIAGGSDAYILPVGIAGLGRMGALSTRNDEPERASRPFDKDRDGFVIGEGAGVLVLEDLETALGRGAPIYGEVLGYATNVDGFHITEPDTENQARCISIALSDAGIRPEQVDYVNAHGTSTPSNDRSETAALKLAFGEHAYKLAISSNKSMIGHLLAGAGAVEAIFTLLSIRDSIVPPTINLETPDPECDLDYVPNTARPMSVNIAISESFGFGGSNAVVVLGKYTG
ncbi:MAG TPA: beta-ketoacyl-[acyl-carrier-protein] synthase II [Dehalococcoidia bacterium]|nr:beta-ketoacyl-[acyl-carrier-protein] synthase II [Dehalococcoidia bacterium]